MDQQPIAAGSWRQPTVDEFDKDGDWLCMNSAGFIAAATMLRTRYNDAGIVGYIDTAETGELSVISGITHVATINRPNASAKG